jgi:hypothetical protein
MVLHKKNNSKIQNMKSFNELSLNFSKLPEYFITHLKNDGFLLKPVHPHLLQQPTRDRLFFYKCLENLGANHVYVCTEGIGVQLTYHYDGDHVQKFFSFDVYGYEQAYDLAVDYVNDNR